MAKKKSQPDEEPLKPPAPKKSKATPTPTPKAKAKTKPPKKATTPRTEREKVPSEVVEMVGHLMRKPPSGSNNTPRDKAEGLLHKAFQADDPTEIERLAREAIEVWPDCADAYSLMAEEADGPRETLRLYTQAVAAGERDIGPEVFRKDAGHFWILSQTRPYMRAMNGYANSLWILGRREQAVEQYEKMLALNPGDNQGIRYILASCLLELGREDEVAALLVSYDDVSACWAYSETLLAFRREGDSPHTQALLAVARNANSHVPDLLTGRVALPPNMPHYTSPGEMSEAVSYAASNLRAWRSAHGALVWLRRRSYKERAPRSRTKIAKPKPKAKGPTPLVKKRLTRLPQSGDAVWQAEYRQLPMWINVDAEPIRPWFVMVVSRDEELILAQDILEEPPTSTVLWDKLVKAMEKPAMGEPHRPTEIQVRSSELWDDLEPHLDDVRIQRSVTGRLDLMDEIVEQLVAHMCGRTLAPGLLEMPGVTQGQVASYFRAAAAFYHAAPWQRVASEETIKIACDRFESGPWYAAVIGQLGMTPGFALYEELGALSRLRDGDASDEQSARETVALSVTFGDQTEIQVADLEDVERHGWVIAAPEGYPSAMRKERGLVMRPPLSWELQLLEACLVAIPAFVLSQDRDDPVPANFEVPTGSGPLKLSLSWI